MDLAQCGCSREFHGDSPLVRMGAGKGRGLPSSQRRSQVAKVRLEVSGEPDQEGIMAISMPILVLRATRQWQGPVSV